MKKVDGIEESSVRLLDRNSSSSESRWVDGSEVDWDEAPLWSRHHHGNGSDGGEGHGSSSIRRRLVKKPKRVDSFDVEAMEIAGSHGHHSEVCIINLLLLVSFFFIIYSFIRDKKMKKT